jgi:DNA-binding NtrC family response regulator
MPSLLIVEDEPKLRRLLVRALEDRPQWTVSAVESAEIALRQIRLSAPDVVLSDIRMSGISGLELLSVLRKEIPAIRFVFMTAYASVGSAVEALRAGALDYLVKPFPNEELFHVLDRIENEIRLSVENQSLRQRLQLFEGPNCLIGSGHEMNQLRRSIEKVAVSRSTVLILGESGTGKEVIARAIHQQSPRAKLPLVRVNCGAIPENLLESELFGHVRGAFTGATEKRIGRFELAGEGTIFLDEMGDLPLNLQVKLLRVLQEREYEPVGSSETRKTNARIIAATNRNLQSAIVSGSFRQDLFYRLNVVTLEAPPLHTHKEDIPDLVDYFIARITEREGIPPRLPTPQFLSVLQSWDWPGNVRELENVIESALVMGESVNLNPTDLPGYLDHNPTHQNGRQGGCANLAKTGDLNLGEATLDEIERAMIVRALDESGGNQSEAARRLGITRRTLGYRRDKYAI